MVASEPWASDLDGKTQQNRQYVLHTTDGELGYPDLELRSGNGDVSEIPSNRAQAA
jgi:hypothetical protein